MKTQAVTVRSGPGILMVLGALSLGACGGGPSPGTVPDAPGLAPGLVVERFLRAANTIAQSREGAGFRVQEMRRELDLMMRLFGTHSEPIIDLYPRENVEVRMLALADLLRHDDYRILGNRIAAGRATEAIEIVVQLDTGDTAVRVPFTVVRTTDGGWRIERVGTENLVSGR